MSRAAARHPVLVDAALVAIALLDAVLSAREEGASRLLVSVLAALGLALRRRWPYVTFALSTVALFTAYVLVAPLVSLYTVAFRTRDRRPVAVCAAIAAAAYYLPWPVTDVDGEIASRDVLGLIYTAVFVGAPVALGLLAQTRQDLADRLVELRAGQQREQDLRAEQVLQAERTRLAREMHDVVSHQVSLIAVQAGALGVTAADERVREAATTIRELSVRTLDELRHMVGVLRGSEGQPVGLVPQPRLADIPQLVRDSGQRVRLSMLVDDRQGWAEPTERAAYRTVQEGLTNVGKHAPGAEVVVEVAPTGVGLRVTVRNGPPAGSTTMQLPTGGHGLAGLRERAELLGGAVYAGPTPDRGFLLEVVLPDATQPPAPGS